MKVLLILLCIYFTSSDGHPGFEKLGSYTYSGPDGTTEKSYWVSSSLSLAWNEAKNICNGYGMKFLHLDSPEEATTFLDLCDANPSLFGDYTHIGGMTTTARSKTDWFWIENGKKVNFGIRWAPGEPDFDYGSEWCLSLAKKNRKTYFNDIRCYVGKCKFMCVDIVKS